MSDLTPESDTAWKKFVIKGDASKLFQKMKMLEGERNEALMRLAEARAFAVADFKACGAACAMRDHETILGSVLRVVRERNDAAERIKKALLCLQTARRNSTGMKLDAYEDLQEAINALES